MFVDVDCDGVHMATITPIRRFMRLVMQIDRVKSRCMANPSAQVRVGWSVVDFRGNVSAFF